MWWKFIKDLKTFLEAQADFNDPNDPIYLQAGATRQNPNVYPMVYLLRYRDRDLDFHRMAEGTTLIWVELWIRNDSAETADAYEQMADLEAKVHNHLREWVKGMSQRMGVTAKVTIPDWKGDGDTMRPCMISQLTLSIEWKRSGIGNHKW